MKIQIRDTNTWALLAEASLNGKRFTAVGDSLICDDKIEMAVIGSGIALPFAFLVTDDGYFIRSVSMELSTPNLSYGNFIELPVGFFSWGKR